jgi:hypothetical protein
MIFKPSLVAAVAGLLSLGSCHPGEKHDALKERRDATMRHYLADANKRAIDACSGAEFVRARQERAMQRRMAAFERLRSERGLDDRQCCIVLVSISSFYQHFCSAKLRRGHCC